MEKNIVLLTLLMELLGVDLEKLFLIKDMV
jgi:hypothetical protein